MQDYHWSSDQVRRRHPARDHQLRAPDLSEGAPVATASTTSTAATVSASTSTSASSRWGVKPDYEIYTLLAERLGFKDLTPKAATEDWNRIVFEKSDRQIYDLRGVQEKGYFVVPSRPMRSPGLLPLVLPKAGMPTCPRAEDPPGPPPVDPIWPLPAARSSSYRRPYGLRSERRDNVPHGPLHPQLGGLRYQGLMERYPLQI